MTTGKIKERCCFTFPQFPALTPRSPFLAEGHAAAPAPGRKTAPSARWKGRAGRPAESID
ncbi:MAG: hypothetical protein Kow0032_29050 [Methyloligellaceae bacterium]